MHRVLPAVLCGLLLAPCALAAPVLQYEFGALAEDQTVTNLAGPELGGQVRGDAQVVALPEADAGAVLQLDGRSGYVEIPGSAGLHIGEDGFTVLATVRFADSGTAEGQPETHDMILFKHNEYLFGRTGKRLYFNLHDGEKWAAAVLGGECRADEWTHAAVIVQRINEPPQGRVGYQVRLFLNGEMVAGREVLNLTGAATEADAHIGRGWGGPWYFRGEMDRVTVYPRAITDAELSQHLRRERLATVVFTPVAEPDPRYPPMLAQVEDAVAAVAPPHDVALRRLLAAVTQAVHHAENQAALLPCLATVERFAAAPAADPVAAFVAGHPEFEFLDSDRVSLGFFAPRPGTRVLCSLFDLQAGREVLGAQRDLWALGYDPPGGGERLRLTSTAPSLSSDVTINRGDRSVVLRWRHSPTEGHPFDGEVRSELRLDGPRLSMTLEVENAAPQVALREVQFPMVRVRRLDEGTDTLFVPRMSGVLHEEPVRRHFRYEGPYPSGAAHMQYFAYLDDHRGVYVGLEDGKGHSKTLLAGAAGDDCEMTARWFVGCPGEGGNDFRISGVAAVELFEGDWFDAAQIYKRFARTAGWWPASHSREDTPQWLRDLTVWFLGNANTPVAEEALVEQREALGLPIGLHWYNWNTEPFDNSYPHFTAREGFAETVARLREAGIYSKPYTNARLWDTLDGGDEDREYTTVALPATLKQPDGSPYIETYARRTFSPMCPAAPVWQQRMADLCAAVAGHGVAAIYLDQVAAARPLPCYDPDHPHVPGAGDAWLEQGYWPMMERIRRELRANHPEIALCTEDAAEPYMHLFDSYLPWRFLDIGRVPAFQAVYAGRIQLTSRAYYDTAYEGLFPKAAEQMLYGEQIGWFLVGHVTANPVFAAFVKKLAHTRLAFLPFFNEGDMARPGRFAEPSPTVTADWGFYGPRIITTPAVLHSAWRLENSLAVLFVNTTCAPVIVGFTAPADDWGLEDAALRALEFHEGADPVAVVWPREALRDITVPPYGMAALLFGGDEEGPAREEQVGAVTALFAYLPRIDEEAGMTPERKREEHVRRSPWVVPDTPARPAHEWIAATSAPKLIRARASEDGSFVGWISDGGSLCFGPVDFGEAGGRRVIECEVAVPETTRDGRLRFLTVADGEGVLWAETALKPTGDYQTYEILRLPLPEDVAGHHPVVIQVNGSGSGICNVRRWRLVREP